MCAQLLELFSKIILQQSTFGQVQKYNSKLKETDTNKNPTEVRDITDRKVEWLQHDSAEAAGYDDSENFFHNNTIFSRSQSQHNNTRTIVLLRHLVDTIILQVLPLQQMTGIRISHPRDIFTN